jgi:hypothetical protein
MIGRIQTRLLLLMVVGVPWTIVVVPFLTIFGVGVAVAYGATFTALFLTALFGALVWEPAYHLTQQWRWEKDWPMAFGLLSGLPELIVTFFIVNALFGGVPFFMFWVHFTSTWVLIWLVANGPMRIFFLRWRYRGGRVL